ncbi:hypothetical protein MBANPS3_012563, partial [Mucor bainieri]
MTLTGADASKRIRLVCRNFEANGINRQGVDHSCSCNPDTPMCKECYQDHLREIWTEEAILNHA